MTERLVCCLHVVHRGSHAQRGYGRSRFGPRTGRRLPRRAGDFLRSDSTEDARPWPETQPTPEPSEPSGQAAAPAPHKVIDGRYELLHSLGRGGMGEVWKALDTRLDRHVAVKGLLGRDAIGAATQEKMMQRARREAAAIAKIRHQNVVAVHDRVESGNQVWIVMDLLNARSLADLMREERRLPVRRTAAIGLQVLGGLRAVHEARVVHRDVKPANVLFAKDDFAILADFGIATFDGAVPLTRAGELIGTFKYLAPELLGQTSQESAATPRPTCGRWASRCTRWSRAGTPSTGRTSTNSWSPPASPTRSRWNTARSWPRWWGS